ARREQRQRQRAEAWRFPVHLDICSRMRQTTDTVSPMLLEPRVSGVNRARKRLGTSPTAAAKLARHTAHSPELLSVATDDLERFLADVAAVECWSQETARVDVALNRDRADMIARSAGVRRVNLWLRRGALLRAERIELAQVRPGRVHVSEVAECFGI